MFNIELSAFQRAVRWIAYVTPKPPKRWLRNANSVFYEKNWHSLDETLLQGFFMLKISDKAYILPLMPP